MSAPSGKSTSYQTTSHHVYDSECEISISEIRSYTFRYLAIRSGMTETGLFLSDKQLETLENVIYTFRRELPLPREAKEILSVKITS